MNLELDSLESVKTKQTILKFSRNGLFLDTGILYLFLVGEYDSLKATDHLKEFSYNLTDYALLNRFISMTGVRNLIITPHIFTEFCKHIQKEFGIKYHDFFPIVADKFFLIEEKQSDKNEIIRDHYHLKLLEIGEHSIIVCKEMKENTNNMCGIITDDSKISRLLETNGRVLVMDFKNKIKWILLSNL